MGSFSLWHWLIVLLVVVLVFGTKKLRNIGSDVGGAMNEFKKAMKEDQVTANKDDINTVVKSDVIEGEVTHKTKQ